jgi:hypothetical protein
MSRSYSVIHTRETCPKHGHASAECGEFCELVEEVYEVEGLVSAYVHARISGPPEDCYPSEGGEVEIDSVDLIVDKTRTPVPDWEKLFTPKELESIDQKLFDAMMDDDGGDYEPDDYDDGDDY